MPLAGLMGRINSFAPPGLDRLSFVLTACAVVVILTLLRG
jgi:hypothetical protein